MSYTKYPTDESLPRVYALSMRKPPNEYTTPDLVRTIRKMLWVINLLDGQEGQGALLDEALDELGLLFREYLRRMRQFGDRKVTSF